MKVFILSHSSGIDGPIDFYEKFLLNKGIDIQKIVHPLDNYEGKSTGIYKNTEKISEFKRKNRGVLNLLFDLISSVKYTLQNNFNIFIGANNFDTFVGVICRIIFRKKIEKIIYFASDFSDQRFGSKILNYIYFKIEKIVIKYSDLVISNTKRAEKKRIDLGLKKDKSLVIPNGIYLDHENFLIKKIKKDKFIFVGNVTKEHGLYEMIDILKDFIGKLIIIGQGDDLDRVVGLCIESGIEYELFIKKDHDFVINYLYSFDGFGLAPYNNYSNWTYYCSPLKVVEYLAMGCPVIVSSVPEIANVVKDRKLGIVYDILDREYLKDEIEKFDSTSFNLKAQNFYSLYNSRILYSSIKLEG